MRLPDCSGLKRETYFWTEEDDLLLRQQVESGVTYKKLLVPPHTLGSTRQRYKQLGLKCVEKAGNGRLGFERPYTEKAGRSPMIEDLYWAAGFYEGEGYAGNATGSTHVAITQKSVEPLVLMQELFGGSIREDNKGLCCWVISGSRARGFLMTMYPLLSTRRQEQVARALQ